MLRGLTTATLATLTLLASLSPVVTGCGAALKPVVVRVSGNVPDATVTVDDQLIGSLKYVSARGLGLPPGKHRITVERSGYFPWDRLVEATEQPVVLDVQMVPIPD